MKKTMILCMALFTAYPMLAKTEKLLCVNGTEHYYSVQSSPETNDLDSVKLKIKEKYVDPNLPKLLFVAEKNEKMYAYTDEENIAMQGRPCWKTDFEYFVFDENNALGIITGMTIDLITPNGGHGQRVYTKKPSVKECHYILIDNIIYKWEQDDYSDLQEFLVYDPAKDMLSSKSKSKTYAPMDANAIK